METYPLTVWDFRGPKKTDTFRITATFAMTEAEARKGALRKGYDLDGWTAKSHTQPVQVATDGDGKKYNFTVTFEKTSYLEVEVEAEDEEQAIEFAKEEMKESSSYDWDDDDTPDVSEVVKGEPVDEDDEDEASA